jgi:hypothetical protein
MAAMTKRSKFVRFVKSLGLPSAFLRKFTSTSPCTCPRSADLLYLASRNLRCSLRVLPGPDCMSRVAETMMSRRTRRHSDMATERHCGQVTGLGLSLSPGASLVASRNSSVHRVVLRSNIRPVCHTPLAASDKSASSRRAPY